MTLANDGIGIDVDDDATVGAPVTPAFDQIGAADRGDIGRLALPHRTVGIEMVAVSGTSTSTAFSLALSLLPCRQMKLFAASVFPDAFGLRKVFDPARYAQTRSDFTTNFRGDQGQLEDMEREFSAAELRAEREEFMKIPHTSRLPPALASIVNADDRVYLDRIAKLASAHGTKLVMLYLPTFDSARLGEDIRQYYNRYGVILDYSDLSSRNTLFVNWAHLNHSGAMVVSDRIADALAPQL